LLENKIINPLENFDFNAIGEYENTIGNYYNFCKNKKPENLDDLIKFNELDLSKYLAENGNLDIDFNKLLESDQ
jgi:hypothetical protein